MLVVFPIPGSPCPPSTRQLIFGCWIPRHTEIIICGQFPSFAITFNRSIVSSFPTTSSKTFGRYFSTLARTTRHAMWERKQSENLHTMAARKGCLVRRSQLGSLVASTSSNTAFVGQIIPRRCKARLHAFWGDKHSGETTESV
jgi:hypothetical protein